MNPVINLGFISIHIYSLCILIGIVCAYFLIIREAERFNIKKEDVSDMLFYTIIFGILGARIYYCLFNIDYYALNILDIFKIWEGGLAIHGGIIAGAITVIFYCKKKNINLLLMFDILVVGLILAQAIGRWGNFFNVEAHGGVTTLSHLKSLYLPKFIIDGMYIDGNYYIPTFLYESIWCLMGFLIMFFLRHKSFNKIGYLTGFYFIFYGFERFLVEGLRTDSLMFLSLKVAQIISIIMLIIGICLLIYSFKKQKKYNTEV